MSHTENNRSELLNKEFCFGGNRFFVLEEMLKLGLNVTNIFAIRGSYLEQELLTRHIPFTYIAGKKELIEQLQHTSFDYFISNGLPYILPLAQLRAGNSKQFINIHPSHLPDLRGINSVTGSILFGRDAGATCHYMNDDIDDGDIIEQVRIPYTNDLDAGILYQLSFEAEKEVFLKSIEKNFKRKKTQSLTLDCIYYSTKEEDKIIDFAQTALENYRQVKAFNVRSKGAYILLENEQLIVNNAELITNPYLLEKNKNRQINEVIYAYENILLIRKGMCCLKLIMRELLPERIKNYLLQNRMALAGVNKLA